MTNDPMKPSEHEAELLAACNAFGPLKGEPGFRLEVSPDQARDLLATVDALRARVAELESAPTDAEIEGWRRTVTLGWGSQSNALISRAVALMRRAKAAEAQDVGRVDPERVDRDVAVDLLTDALDRAADPGHQGWDFVNLSGEIVDAILRAARGGAT